MSISSIPQTAHKLGMAGKLTQPREPQTAITLVLGFGQTIAFASSFHLLGVLGDVIATDLALSPTFAFLPAFYGFALAESPRMALALSAGLCLVMFSMTFGLERRLQPQKEEAAA